MRFRWVALQLAELEKCLSPYEIDILFAELPKDREGSSFPSMSVSEPTTRTQPSFITFKYILSTAIVAAFIAILGIFYAASRTSEGRYQDNQFGLLELAPGLNPIVE